MRSSCLKRTMSTVTKKTKPTAFSVPHTVLSRTNTSRVYGKLRKSLDFAHVGKHGGPRPAKARKGQKGRAPAWLNHQAELVGPRVAIIGRTNVGKSTLFNMLVGDQLALTDNSPGVTRDRQEAQARLVDLEFALVDTPGIEELSEQELRRQRIRLDSRAHILRGMREQSEKAIDMADVVLLMYDAKLGVTHEDKYLAHWLKRRVDLINEAHDQRLAEDSLGTADPDVPRPPLPRRKHVILIANKAEVYLDWETIVSQTSELNLGPPVCLSSTSSIGIPDLFHALDEAFIEVDRWRGLSVGSTGMVTDGRNDLNSDANEESLYSEDPMQEIERMKEKYKHETMESLAYTSIHDLQPKILDSNPSYDESNLNSKMIDGNSNPSSVSSSETESLSDILRSVDSDFELTYDATLPSQLNKRRNAGVSRRMRKKQRNKSESDSPFDAGFSPRMPRSKLIQLRKDPITNEVIYADEFGEITESEMRDYEMIAAMERSEDPKVLSEARLMKSIGEDPECLFQENSALPSTMTSFHPSSSEPISAKDFPLKMCIIGRPNVGKSSLINAMLGEQRCLVADAPGITRDSVSVKIFHKPSGMNIHLIDTAGIIGTTRGAYERKQEASKLNVLAMKECLRSVRFCNVVTIVVDINEKVLDTLDETELTEKLIFYSKGKTNVEEYYPSGLSGSESGYDSNFSESRNHLNGQSSEDQSSDGRDIDATAVSGVSSDMSDDGYQSSNSAAIRKRFASDYHSFAGGHSNRYSGSMEGRMNDYEEMDELDTLGMDRLHNESVTAAKHIVNALLSATDRQMIEYVISQGRGCVLCINKWDRMHKKQREILRLLKHCLPLVFKETGGLPIVICSAKYDKGIDKLLGTVMDVYQRWNSRIPTSLLNKFVYEMQKIYPPPRILRIKRQGRWKKYICPRIRYLTQYTIRPPSFIGFCGSQIVSDYYFYRMRRLIRQEFGLIGVPIRIKLKSSLDTMLSSHLHHSSKLWSSGGIKVKNTIHKHGRIKLKGRGRDRRLLKEDWIEMRLQHNRRKMQQKDALTEQDRMRQATEKKLTVERFQTVFTADGTLVPV